LRVCGGNRQENRKRKRFEARSPISEVGGNEAGKQACPPVAENPGKQEGKERGKGQTRSEV
jgi:hypothetical protein